MRVITPGKVQPKTNTWIGQCQKCGGVFEYEEHELNKPMQGNVLAAFQKHRAYCPTERCHELIYPRKVG